MVAECVCTLKLKHESYSYWKKMQREAEHESLWMRNLQRLWDFEPVRNLEKVLQITFSFSSPSLFRPLQLSCVYMVWFGMQNTMATEKRYFIKKPGFILYQS